MGRMGAIAGDSATQKACFVLPHAAKLHCSRAGGALLTSANTARVRKDFWDQEPLESVVTNSFLWTRMQNLSVSSIT